MAFEIDYLLDFTPIVAPKMIRTGMKILKPVLKQNLTHSIGSNLKHKSRSKGNLLESVRVSNTFFKDNGRRFTANIYFDGTNRHGVRQGEKAAYKEYGTRMGEAGTGYIEAAVRSTRGRVIQAMKDVLERELHISQEEKHE